jgi:hypothetical protein
MNFFNKTEKINTLEEKFNYIKNHFKYWTMNSWNGLVSIANNVKIYNLGLDKKQLNKAFEIIECEDFYFDVKIMIEESGLNAGFNGRSGGYLVLYNEKNYTCAVDTLYWDFEKFGEFCKEYEPEVCENIIECDFELVQSFDILCDEIREHLIYLIENAEVETQEYTTRHERKIIAVKAVAV